MDSAEKKQMIRNAFNTVAKGYDNPALPFFPATAQKLLKLLALEPGSHVLDVCTGTGAVAIPAAEICTHGHVTGIDLSSGMLEQARRHAKDHGLENVTFLEQDAEQHQLNQLHFDALSCSFGLFFIEDMQSTLNNLLTCVKPGGKIAISSFTGEAFEPCSSLFLKRYESFGNEIPPLSWKRLDEPGTIHALFDNAGLENTQLHHHPLGHDLYSAEDWWEIVWNAGFRGLLNQLSDEETIAFKRQHLAEIGALCELEPFWLNTEVLIATAQKPA